MNQELSFETIPFELDPEIQGEIFEEESKFGRRRSFGGGGSRSFRPRSQPGLRSKGTKRPPIPRPRPIPRGPRRPWEVIREPNGLASEPYPVEPEPSGSEQVRWVQDCLNQILGLQLPVTGFMGPETRSAMRSFQRQQGLRVSGIIGPDTEVALSAACGRAAPLAAAEESELAWASEGTPPPKLPPFSHRLSLAELWGKANRIKWKNTLSKKKGEGVEGVYVIYSPQKKDGRGVQGLQYVGESQNVYKRLLDHVWCLTQLCLDPARRNNDQEVVRFLAQHKIHIAIMSYSKKQERKQVETALITCWKPLGAITNQKLRELEEELRGDF